MSSSSIVWLVARREILAKLRDKGFILSTVFILVAILGSIVLQVFLQSGTATYDVGVVGSGSSVQSLEPALQAQAHAVGAEVRVRSFDDTAAARKAVSDGDLDAAVDDGQAIVESSLDSSLEGILNGAVASVAARDRLVAVGLDPAQVGQALDVPPLQTVTLDRNAERTSQRQVVAFLGVTVLYGLLILIGQYVASGVVEEKASRVVELLLATIKPWQLLAGKVIGLGLLGVAQLLIVCVLGTAAAIGFDVLAVPGDAIITLAQVVGWFVLGYAFFAAAFAMVASLVSRQEDLQTVVLPLVAVLVAAFIVAIQAGQNPDGLLARITSLIPPLSPMVMPVRAAGGGVPWWESLLAVVLMVAAVVGMVRLGGRAYAGALLRTGGKLKLRHALAGSRS